MNSISAAESIPNLADSSGPKDGLTAASALVNGVDDDFNADMVELTFA